MKILIAYTSKSGSTAEVALSIGEVLTGQGCETDVKCFDEVQETASYQAVLIGAPVILGWHRAAVGFVRRWQRELSRIPVAYFMTALKLTGDSRGFDDIDIALDPDIVEAPKREGRMSFAEHRTSLKHYLRPVLKKISRVAPAHVAVFNGKLDYKSLKLPQMLFVMLIIRAQAGDFRDWTLIRQWTEHLYNVWKEK